MKIVLPYVGSKARYFPLLRETIPKKDLYIEPFAGGFSLGLNLLEEGIVKNPVINDLNSDVANFWRCLQEDYWRLVSSVDKFIDLFIGIVRKGKRFKDNSEVITKYMEDKYDQAALFYTYRKMNKGTSTKSISYDIDFGEMQYSDRFYEASQLIADAEIYNMSYEKLDFLDNESVLWLLDPPYYSAFNYHYYGKSSGNFDHSKFKDFVRKIKGDFILFDIDCKETREIYSDFIIQPVRIKSTFNLKGFSEELVVSNRRLDIIEQDMVYNMKQKNFESLVLSDVIDEV